MRTRNLIKSKIAMITLVILAALSFATLMTVSPGSPKAQAAASYPFPGRAEDLQPGYYWYLQNDHGGGIQTLGYDLGAARFDPAENAWTRRRFGITKDEYAQNKQNSSHIVYGLPVHAIADGEVMYCWRNAPENPAPGETHPEVGNRISNAGNFLKVKHADGEYVLYAHFKPGTIPANVCPFNGVLRNSSADSELPPENRPHITKGQLLGQVGNSGHSSGPHLHINLQKTLFDEGGSENALPMPFHDAWVKSATILADSTTGWEMLQGEPLTPPTLILPDYSKGFSEIARHSIKASDYQFVFDHITNSGYRPVWVDGYEVNGQNYFNAIFHPADGVPWAARHGMTSAQYQQEFDTRKAQGYRLLQVESYPDGNAIRYAAIFVKQAGPTQYAYHGRTAAEHQALFDWLKTIGYCPVNISVVSINGQLSYMALYELKNVGVFEARSFLTPGEYQTKYDDNKAAGRKLVYLNAYNHAGGVRFTAIWHSAVAGSTAAKHGLTGAEYQDQWETWTGAGYQTRLVTGYDAGTSANFAAMWRK